MNQYLTIADLKAILHIGNSRAYSLVQSRGFPSFRVGEGIWLIDPEGLADWCRKLQKSPDKGASL